MNLPYPFDKAKALKPDLAGRIALIDAFGKVLACIPLQTAFELTPRNYYFECERSGHTQYGYAFVNGDGFGDSYYADGDESGWGYGIGESYGVADINGSGKSKP